MNKLLSINIPTYNRSSLLLRLLHSISAQSLSSLSLLEVHVLDNASDDCTLELLDSLSLNYSLYIHTSPFNYGPQVNIQKAHRCGASKYIWVFGDDDYLMPGALDFVLSILDSQPDLLLLSYEKRTINGSFLGLVTTPNIAKSEIFRPRPDQVLSLDPYIGFLSCNIIRRFWVDSVADAQYAELDSFGEIAHSYICYLSALRGGSVGLISDPVVSQTTDNGYLSHEMWMYVCFDYCVSLQARLSELGVPSALRFFRARLRKEVFRRALSESYRGREKNKLLRDIKLLKYFPFYKLIIYLIVMLPSRLVRSIHDLVYPPRE